MDAKVRLYVTELLGTFLFVFIGAGAVCAHYLPNEVTRLEPTGIALAEGFALAVVLTVSYQVSGGCLNPAVTLMLWVFKRLDGARTLGLIGVQLLGSALAGLLLHFTFSEEVLKQASYGTPHVQQSLLGEGNTLQLAGLISGIGVEFLLTILVTLAIFSSLIDPRGPRLGGVLVGLAQSAAILLGFNLTGGAANPARWFGPAIWQFTLPDVKTKPLADHAVYWIGPVLGALAAGLFYSTFILPPEKKK